MVNPPPDTRMPRWVKVSGIIGSILVMLVVIMLFMGHGPGRHISAISDRSPASQTTNP